MAAGNLVIFPDSTGYFGSVLICLTEALLFLLPLLPLLWIFTLLSDLVGNPISVGGTNASLFEIDSFEESIWWSVGVEAFALAWLCSMG